MLNRRAVIVSFKVKAIILERFGSFKNLQGRSFQKQGTLWYSQSQQSEA